MTYPRAVAWTIALLVLGHGALAQERAHPLQTVDTRKVHRPEVPGVHGLVTAGHPLASMAGLRILMKGGNAVDASVAVLATLNVVRPQMSGAAGNGFITFFEKSTGEVHSLSATGAAPMALRAEELSPEELNKGMSAGVVPGLFGGWIAALDRFGTMSLAEVLEPAIDYAENGHPIEESVVRTIARQKELFESFPTSARVFLPQGRVPLVGETFRMADLARTFRKVVEAEQDARRKGRSRSEALTAAFDRFYKGDLAQEMARFYRDNGGAFTEEDFAAYQTVWGEPVHTTYRGYDIYTSPPTSRGGLEVLMQLNLIEGYDIAALEPGGPEQLHLMAEAIKLTKADIYHYVADTKRFDVPVAGMLSKEYAAGRRALLERERAKTYGGHGSPPGATSSDARLARPAPPVPPAPFVVTVEAALLARERSYPGSTTSFSIVDEMGNALACTPTHGGAFGTSVVVGNTGLTFNNGTRIGSTSPYPEDVNYARGGQIPILNNSPIIVLRDGEFVLALGTPGGETIGQTQFQVLVNILDFGMSIQAAIEAPRFSIFADPNFYKPGAELLIRLEDRMSLEALEGLTGRGHRVETTSGYALGSIQGILVNMETGTMTAGADPRRAAYAVGW